MTLTLKEIIPGGASGKESSCQCKRHKRRGFDPWVGKLLWRRASVPLAEYVRSEGWVQVCLSPACFPLMMKEFCAKTLLLLILAHSDGLTVWAPDEPPLWPAGWMSLGKPSHLRGSLPFSGYSRESGVDWGWESRLKQNWKRTRLSA